MCDAICESHTGGCKLSTASAFVPQNSRVLNGGINAKLLIPKLFASRKALTQRVSVSEKSQLSAAAPYGPYHPGRSGLYPLEFQLREL